MPCPQGTYSLNTDSKVCTPCDKDIAICPGKNNITLKTGYWRNSLEEADQIFKCPNQEACL